MEILMTLFLLITEYPIVKGIFVYIGIKKNGETTMAEVKERKVKQYHQNGRVYYEYKYLIAYEVDNESFLQWLPFYMYDNYREGSIIRVYYNKKAPCECLVLNESEEKRIRYMFILGAAGIIIGMTAIWGNFDGN